MKFLIFPGNEVVVKKTVSSEIKKWDIIVFKDPVFKNPVTHRVVRKVVCDGEEFFITKGDFNLKEDFKKLSSKYIIGKVVKINKSFFLLI